MDMEIWKEVKGHPNYIVSNHGRVINQKTGREMHQQMHKSGSLRVALDGTKYYVHRLVAEAFFNGDSRGMDVIHLDGNMENNFVGNLQYMTRSENRLRRGNGEMPDQKSIESNVDFVVTVRCKNCIHRNDNDFCRSQEPYFYCANGEFDGA